MSYIIPLSIYEYFPIKDKIMEWRKDNEIGIIERIITYNNGVETEVQLLFPDKGAAMLWKLSF